VSNWLLALGASLALSAGPAAYSFKDAQGIEHYVGSEDDIPPAYRPQARRIDLSGQPAEAPRPGGWHTFPAPAPVRKQPPNRPPVPPREALRNPTIFALAGGLLLCLFPGFLLAWLRAPHRRRIYLAAATASLVAGLSLGLYATRQLRPKDAHDLVELKPP
jgi:hypothetical protein